MSKGKPTQSMPFSEPDNHSDVVFLVENKKIHFTKTLLTISSPVFQRMFDGDFAEKEQKEINLPEKKYSEVVEFFKQLHPRFVVFSPITDQNLLFLLELSREYQVDAVRQRCKQYIRNQTVCAKGEGLTALQLSELLYACEEYEFETLVPRLVPFAATKSYEDLAKCPFYNRLSLKLTLAVTKSRCLKLEAAVLKISSNINNCDTDEDDTSDCSCPKRRSWDSSCCSKCFLTQIKNVIKKI